MLTFLLSALLISLGINGLLFLIAYRFQSDKLTDASYALSFLALVAYSFSQSQLNSYVLIGLILVTVWALRIGGFLLYRVVKTGKDRRFDGLRENFWKIGKFWLAQAMAVWVLMIPIMLVFQQGETMLSIAYIGVIIWLVGLVIETLADAQKYRFTQNPKNTGKWIDRGIWQYSRHPNYFGEILVWFGIYLFAIPALSVPQTAVGAISPIFIIVLLLFVSGIPILEKSADKKWGKQKAYQDYRRRTSILILLPKKSR